jgi:uncharacterized membrane protein YkvA (DUF1232 family)
MNYGQIIALLDESGLLPEALSGYIGVSGSTYRRWLKAPANEKVPEEYLPSVGAGVYRLLSEGLLNHDSPRVTQFLENNLPGYFSAVVGFLGGSADLASEKSPHDEKIIAALSSLGSSGKIREKVNTSKNFLQAVRSWSEEWKTRINLLSNAINLPEITLVDKLAAYGALFYLCTPLDLVPDTVPVFGYVDDFGILGFAVAYYAAKFPHLVKA